MSASLLSSVCNPISLLLTPHLLLSGSPFLPQQACAPCGIERAQNASEAEVGEIAEIGKPPYLRQKRHNTSVHLDNCES